MASITKHNIKFEILTNHLYDIKKFNSKPLVKLFNLIIYKLDLFHNDEKINRIVAIPYENGNIEIGAYTIYNRIGKTICNYHKNKDDDLFKIDIYNMSDSIPFYTIIDKY